MSINPTGLTVGYVWSRALSSQVIEYREAGGPSHATTLVAPGYVIDARLSGGVARRPVSYLAGQPMRWFRVPATDAQVKATIDFLKTQCGQRYDWLDIIAFAIPPMFKHLSGATHPWMCSYLQGGAEIHGGVLPKLARPTEKLDPNDMLIANSAQRGCVELSGPIFS